MARETKTLQGSLKSRLKEYQTYAEKRSGLKYFLAGFLINLNDAGKLSATLSALDTSIASELQAYLGTQKEPQSSVIRQKMQGIKTLGDVLKLFLKRRRLAFLKGEYASEAGNKFKEFRDLIETQERLQEEAEEEEEEEEEEGTGDRFFTLNIGRRRLILDYPKERPSERIKGNNNRM